MTIKNQFYKCGVCGNLAEVFEVGDGALMCCKQEMELLEEKDQSQEGKEKHVPVISVEDGTISVKVGSTPHPMEEEHYIELIQLLKEGEVIVEKRLKPSDEPKANFCCVKETKGVSARALCNIHGLWVS